MWPSILCLPSSMQFDLIVLYNLQPIRKSAVTVSGARMRSKSTAGLKKPKASITATSSKCEEEAPTHCIPKNIKFLAPDEDSQKKLLSESSSYSSANPTNIISRTKSNRRKSFTSSLVARPEVTRHFPFPYFLSFLLCFSFFSISF